MGNSPPVLETLGSRLRARRQSLRMTQGALAEAAGVSRRFLVQLEAGEGNISVNRLVSVCGALQLSLETLFRGVGPSQPRILSLVGLRGAGKSTIGRALAEQTGCPFVELDQLVEQEAGMSLAEIFELRGESHYRDVEMDVLRKLLDEPTPQVIATGGSIVTSPQSWRRLRERTTTVWLEASPRSHLQRVTAQGDLRPMRGRPNALAELEQILAERRLLYAQAEHTVDTDALDIDAIVSTIARI